MFLPYSRIFPRCCPRLMIDEEWFSRSRVHFHLPALRERRITRCTTLINFHLMAMCCKAQCKRALPSIFSEDKWVASTTSSTSAITPCWSQRIMGLLQVIYERVGISTPNPAWKYVFCLLLCCCCGNFSHSFVKILAISGSALNAKLHFVNKGEVKFVTIFWFQKITRVGSGPSALPLHQQVDNWILSRYLK